MTGAEFLEVTFKHPDGENMLQITPEYDVLLNGKVREIDFNGALVLSSLVKHINNMVPTADIWKDVKGLYRSTTDIPASVQASIKGQVVRLQKGLGTYRRLDTTGMHIFILGAKSMSQNILLGDISTPDIGLDMIAKNAESTGKTRHAVYYQERFLEAYAKLFNCNDLSTSTHPASAESQDMPKKSKSAGRRATNTPEEARANAEKVAKNQAAYTAEKATTIQEILNSPAGSEFSHDDLTDGAWLDERKKKANFEAVRVLLGSGLLSVRRDRKGRAVYVRTGDESGFKESEVEEVA